MRDFFGSIGVFGLVITVILAVIFIFAIKNAYLLYLKKPNGNLNRLGRSINSMLFWGGIVFVLSFLGTFITIQVNIPSIVNPDPRVIFAGIHVLLKLVIYGLTSFTIIALVWFLFTNRLQKLLERSMKTMTSSNLLYLEKPNGNLTRLGRIINSMLFWGAVIFILVVLCALIFECYRPVPVVH
jgi:hypothetical protein